MDNSCLFCRFASKELPVDILYEDDHVIVFPDIAPIAPVHLLVVPKIHIASVAQAADHQGAILGHLFLGARKAAAEKGLLGYKTVVNVEAQGGQEIMHVHMHVLGGTALTMPLPSTNA